MVRYIECHIADDQSRVCVTGDPAVEGSDYINASFIDVCKTYNSSYIAFNVLENLFPYYQLV